MDGIIVSDGVVSARVYGRAEDAPLAEGEAFVALDPEEARPGDPWPDAKAVDRARDRRIEGGFIFDGTAFQTDPKSVERIAGTASAAHIAITLDGAEAGDLRWADPDSDFVWIATDNSRVEMDALTAIAFGKAYMAHERALILAASAIKARIRAGETVDIETAEEWP